MQPKGLDTDRIQFLLHDTLKEESGKDAETIKLVLGMLPESINVADKGGALPFLIACQYSSLEVVKYLMGRDNHGNNMCAFDDNGDTVLHYACRGNNFKIVNYLLTKHMQLVTKRNIEGDLPLYLLCGITGEGKINSMKNDIEHLETIWRLLLAYPEDVSHK